MPGKRARRVRREAARKRPKPGQSRQGTSPCSRPYYVILEAAGLKVQLVNARTVKNVPGRAKTDKKDAVWLAKVVERGMCRPSLVHPKPIRQLRDLTRYRRSLIREQSREKQRLEKVATWKKERVAAAKMFKTKLGQSLPIAANQA